MSHFIFRLSPADLVVFAGVLNNTQESSEDTKVVRQVTELFVHEGFVYGPLINDIAIMKVGIRFMYERQAFYFNLHIYVKKYNRI
jgi:hypothetical protein